MNTDLREACVAAIQKADAPMTLIQIGSVVSDGKMASMMEFVFGEEANSKNNYHRAEVSNEHRNSR
jgi:hypothetical protein